MMTYLSEWARRWNIPAAALGELQMAAFRLDLEPKGAAQSEGVIQAQVRLKAARMGKHLFRNNLGAGKLENGSFIRWGLANDSKALNDRFKSADLIGWEQIVIQSSDVGRTIARVLSVECKRSDWKYTGTSEEQAQMAWATLVNSCGGRAIFATSPGAL